TGIRLAHLYNENISRFGFSENELIIAENKGLLNNEFITVNGIHIHSGSNITSIDKFDKTICKYENIIRKYLKNNESRNYLNLGGGIPANSASKDNVNISKYIYDLYETIKKYNICDLNKIKVIFEPGRYFVEDHGYFIFKLHRLKKRHHSNLYIADIGINWLPSLNSWEHSLESIKSKDDHSLLDKNQMIMGFNCFENDYIASSVQNIILDKDDIFIIRGCGAYDIQTSSYWTRVGREIYSIENGHFELIRRKQTYKELRSRDTRSFPYLKLDNLTLHPPSVNFSKELHSLIEKNKNYLSKYLNWVKYISSEEDIKGFLLKAIEEFDSASKIYIIKYDEKLVGVISLDNLDKSNGIVYIGYWLSEDAQGKGIISKSINILIESHKDLY
ncbi:GNAT family N-acetyltransferase, partial [Rodentibacter genomosp. 2]|uniref:GNAT family N-acetyltransferase n=1 Tax=Rodentibacter genomosp. 2 TaxID=1908266 RepID=UPI00117BB608